MKFLQDFSFKELSDILTEYKEPKFRIRQLFEASHKYKSYFEMSNIPFTLKNKLIEDGISDKPVEIIETLTSKDGTQKFLFKLFDGNIIEGVLMKYKYGYTQCVSTQVGCRMHCAFCASGLNGLVRNLSSGEILGQVLAVNKLLGGEIGDKRKVTNIVLMGSGEPLDNYDNTVAFLRNVSDENGICISPRNISLSTSGIVPKIYDLANENMPVNLTISLHFPFDDERKEIMPVAKKYTIKEILAACENYFNKTKRRYIFEYVLIYGKNDTKRHADELIKLLSKRPCHVNLIRLNIVKENDFKAVTDKNAYKFAEYLNNHGISATVRRRMGDDIKGACGQLRRKYIENSFDSEINLN